MLDVMIYKHYKISFFKFFKKVIYNIDMGETAKIKKKILLFNIINSFKKLTL